MADRAGRTTPKTARFTGLSPASARSSSAARGASKKRDTRCELVLRRALWRLGLRYRVDVRTLPGRPDIVFARVRLVVFVDGDFWHGRNLEERVRKLAVGHNAPYWLAKIRGNVQRDRLHEAELRKDGWDVLRFWETEVTGGAELAASQVAKRIAERRGQGCAEYVRPAKDPAASRARAKTKT